MPRCSLSYAKKVQIESRTCQACLSNYAEMQPFLCKITHFISYKHQNHQKIIQYSDNLTIIHTIPHYFGCKTKERCKGNANREQNLPSLLGQLCRGAAYLIQNYIQSSEPPNMVCSCPTLICRCRILHSECY